MKKLSRLIWLMIAMASIPLLHSCLDDNDDYASQMQLSTVRLLDKDNFYFEFDNGHTLYPGEGGYIIREYEPKAGQRVFVHYDVLEEPVEGYTYNGKIRYIQNILTKGIIPLTEETADSIGDDRINAVEMLISGGYLNIYFQYYGTHTENNKHMLNLVQNETLENSESDYIPLEFRHNAYDDVPSRLGWGYVCFSLKEIEELMKNKKGLEIRVNTIYNGIQTERIDFKKSARATWTNSMHIDSSVNSSQTIK